MVGRASARACRTLTICEADSSTESLSTLAGVILEDVALTHKLLPLVVKGAPVGLIYADKCEAGAIVPSEKELSLLRTLRNQAVMAFRQASGGEGEG